MACGSIASQLHNAHPLEPNEPKDDARSYSGQNPCRVEDRENRSMVTRSIQSHEEELPQHARVAGVECQ